MRLHLATPWLLAPLIHNYNQLTSVKTEVRTHFGEIHEDHRSS